MKKIISILVILVMAMSLLAGCGASKSDTKEEEKPQVSPEAFETLGEFLDVEPEDEQVAIYDEYVIYACQIDGTYYRATADITKEQGEEYGNIDFSQDDYKEKQKEVLGDLKITKMEKLNDQILSQDDLDKLAGKTGKELVKEGWIYTGSYDLEGMNIEMSYGPFNYTVVFDGKVDEKDYEDYDVEKGTADMKVKEASFSMLGDATNIE